MNTVNQTELAKKLGVSRQYVASVLSGKIRVGANMAKKLEEATCVNRLAWMYPDEYPNPMVHHQHRPADEMAKVSGTSPAV